MKVLRLFLYLVTYLGIVATFFNDGFSRMFFAGFFLLFLLADSAVTQGVRTFILNGIAVGTLLVVALTRFSNPYIYPILQKKLVTTKDYVLTHSPYDTHTLIETKELPYDSKKELEIYKTMDLYKQYILKKGTLITPKKVVISGHPDFGVSYQLQIDMNDSKLESKVKQYILSHHKDISYEIDKRLPKAIQNRYRQSVPNTTDEIYAGDWYFKNFPKENIFKSDIESVVEKKFGWIVWIFNPIFIWIYLIIFALEFFYIWKKYKQRYPSRKTKK